MVAWIKFRQGWRTPVWGGVLVSVAILLDFLPLVDVLGYDSSFVLGLVVAVAAADVGHGVVSAARRNAPSTSSARLAGEAMATALALLVLPLLLSLANALRVRNCNLGAGFLFFALLPVGTAVFAAGTAAAVAILVPRPRLGRAAALALPFVSIGWALLRLYRDPAVFAFDPFGGYFPGPIYDEALRPPLRLFWYRLANLTWLATAVAAAAWLRPRLDDRLRLSLRPWNRPALVVALAAASLAWFVAEGNLGVHITHDDLARILPRETKTRHFVLRTDPRAEDETDVARFTDELEFRYHQLASILGAEPTGPVRVYLFPSAEAKKDAVGAANTLFTKPWTREIFLHSARFPARHLRHELAHIFAGAFGDPLFGISLQWRFWGPLPLPHLAGGLIEGIAMAADFGDPPGRSTLHEESAAMIALGQAPELRRALGAGFTLESGPRAYTLVGSFCRFLLDRFGAAKLRALYRSAGAFEAVYGRDLVELEKDWRAFLAKLPVDDEARAEAEEDFRRPAIFRKVCARELAARVSEARAVSSGDPAKAVALLESTCADDPGEPTFRLELAEMQIAAGQPERALATIQALQASGPLTRPLRSRAANLEAGIHFRARRIPETEAALARALATASDDGELRFAKARQRSLADQQAAATLGRVIFGDERGRPLDPALALYLLQDFQAHATGDDLGPYLVGRQLVFRDPELAYRELQGACWFDRPKTNWAPVELPADCRKWLLPEPEAKPLDPLFLKECRRLLGESAYLAGHLSDARAAFEWLSRDADDTADRLRAQDFLERIAWKQRASIGLPTDAGNGTTMAHDGSQVPPRQ